MRFVSWTARSRHPVQLSIYCFNIQNSDELPLTSHTQALDYLKQLGFPVSPRYQDYTDPGDVQAEIENMGESRGTLDFDIDGAVVKVDKLQQREASGSTARVPRWAAAYELPARGQGNIARGYHHHGWPYRCADA